MSVFCNLGANSLGLQSIFVPETFRGRREGTDANRAGSKRHLRVRVLYAQPRSPVSVNPGRFRLAIHARAKKAPRALLQGCFSYLVFAGMRVLGITAASR